MQDKLIMVGLVVLVILALFFHEWRSNRSWTKELKTFREEADRLHKLHSTDTNIANRLVNELKAMHGVKVLKSNFGSGYHITVFRAEGDFFKDGLVGITVDSLDKERFSPIFVRYEPSMAAGWFGTKEEELIFLIGVLKDHIKNTTAVMA